jgi:chromosome segregation ATPase
MTSLPPAPPPGSGDESFGLTQSLADLAETFKVLSLSVEENRKSIQHAHAKIGFLEKKIKLIVEEAEATAKSETDIQNTQAQVLRNHRAQINNLLQRIEDLENERSPNHA